MNIYITIKSIKNKKLGYVSAMARMTKDLRILLGVNV